MQINYMEILYDLLAKNANILISFCLIPLLALDSKRPTADAVSARNEDD